MTSCSHSHGFLELAVIWPVAVMANLGKWPDLTWLVNTKNIYIDSESLLNTHHPPEGSNDQITGLENAALSV